jgi:hypothetical protein
MKTFVVAVRLRAGKWREVVCVEGAMLSLACG